MVSRVKIITGTNRKRNIKSNIDDTRGETNELQRCAERGRIRQKKGDANG